MLIKLHCFTSLLAQRVSVDAWDMKHSAKQQKLVTYGIIAILVLLILLILVRFVRP